MPPHHPVMPDMPQFIYHNEKTRQFFGRYSNITKEVEFETKTLSPSPREVVTPPTAVVTALSTESPSSASTLPAQSIGAETVPQTASVSSQLEVTIPSSPKEKVSVPEIPKPDGTTAAMWWWQDMRSG